ncbi:MAG: hypothetical protein J7K68_02350 [Candidatus Diapherotrites archaeon]|nr:hypothetical protein [Candidatus Diapherotrites archaeon]
MYATVKFTGIIEQILEKAVELGIAKTKTEALRLAVLELNNKYNLLERNIEDELAIKKMQKIDREIAKGRRKLLSEKQALGKYR